MRFVNKGTFNKYSAGFLTINIIELRMKVADPIIIVEKVFDKSITKIWKAITELDQMKIGFSIILDYNPEVGLKTQFNAQAPNRDFSN